MLWDEQVTTYRALNQWFLTPQGCRVAHSFMDELSHVNEQLKGENLLQLGSCGDNLWLSDLQFKNKWIATPHRVAHSSAFLSSLNALSIDRDSMDCIIAPLTMEAMGHGRDPIDEIDRVLKPMGYAILFGINPFSFWGAALGMKRLSCFGPGKAVLTSSFALTRMMIDRGYRQCALTGFYYIPPVSNDYLIQKLEFLNEMGKMIWPFPAGFYCLIVQKYQHRSPSIRFETLQECLILQEKSSLQPITKVVHDERFK